MLSRLITCDEKRRPFFLVFHYGSYYGLFNIASHPSVCTFPTIQRERERERERESPLHKASGLRLSLWRLAHFKERRVLASWETRFLQFSVMATTTRLTPPTLRPPVRPSVWPSVTTASFPQNIIGRNIMFLINDKKDIEQNKQCRFSVQLFGGWREFRNITRFPTAPKCHGVPQGNGGGRWHGAQVFVGRMTLPLDPATHLAWLAVISTDRRADGGDDGGGGGGGGGPGSLLSFWGLGVAERGP